VNAGNCDGQTTCTVVFPVDTAGWGTSPNHTLQSVMGTTNNVNAQSPVQTVHLFSPTKIWIGAPANLGGGSMQFTGTLNVTSTGYPASGAPVSVRFTPAYGSPSTVTTTVDPQGLFHFSYKAAANTSVTVTAGDARRWGTSSMSTSFTLARTFSCSLAPGAVTHGKSKSVRCKVPGLPSGVATTLSVGPRKTATVAHGHSTSGKISFSVKPKKKGTTPISVSFAANKVYDGSAWNSTVKVK
jgi:hypothetical protein